MQLHEIRSELKLIRSLKLKYSGQKSKKLTALFHGMFVNKTTRS